jgi:hypothetical protein
MWAGGGAARQSEPEFSVRTIMNHDRVGGGLGNRPIAGSGSMTQSVAVVQ